MDGGDRVGVLGETGRFYFMDSREAVPASGRVRSSGWHYFVSFDYIGLILGRVLPIGGSAMSFTDQLAKIEKAKAEIAAAEAKLAADRVAALAKLPSDYGFDDVNVFIKAVKDAHGSGAKAAKPGRKARAAGTSEPKAPKAGKGGKRAKITDEIKAQVKAMAEAGKTGQEIAKALGISPPSVQNIKKAFGMVKPRGSSEAAPEAAPAAPEVAPAPAPAPEVAPAPAA